MMYYRLGARLGLNMILFVGECAEVYCMNLSSP